MNRPIRRSRLPVFFAAGLTIAACGGDSEASESTAPPVEGSDTSVAETSPPTTQAPTTTRATTTTAAPTTTPATTGASAAPASTAPPKTSAEPEVLDDRDVVAAMIDAYNAGDWDAFLATVVEHPSPETPVGEQTPEWYEFDFQWSDAMGEVWTLGECVDRGDELVCNVTIEDDLHRALAPLGLEASECQIVAQVVDGLVDLRRYELFPCHTAYDAAMHAYGAWFAENHPDETPIDGFHYRGWNQTRPEMAPRAAELIDEYLASGEATIGVDHH